MESIIPEGKVHFYEYMQVQLLQEYIEKGINYFVNAILNAFPKLIRLRYYSQQISLLINFLKDFIYLIKYKATYAESFFQLERESLSKDNKLHNLSKLKILYHAAIMTVVPYLINKIDSYYNEIIEEQANEGKVLSTLQKIFTKIYPYCNMILSIVQVLMKFRFLLVQSAKQYDLYYKASKSILQYQQGEQTEQEGESVHYPWKDLIKTPGLLTILISHKVLTWYFNQKNQKKVPEIKANDQQKYSSPLTYLSSGKFGQKVKQKKQYKKGVCLICSKPFTNPTVIRQNGHVFCYSCISNYVKQNGKCPITQIAVTPQNLQLIY